MGFYQEWINIRERKLDDSKYFQSFLDYSEESMKCLLNGEKEDVVLAVRLLLSIPIEDFISEIKHDYIFESKDIFQYSNLDDAAIKLCDLLTYQIDKLTFLEAGQKLTHANSSLACVKYGENHIKLANAFTFVTIEKHIKPRISFAAITSLGEVSTTLEIEERTELIRRLAIRNNFIKSLLYNAKIDDIEYYNLAVRVLSGQTIIRRKNNVKIIIGKILEDNSLAQKIRW